MSEWSTSSASIVASFYHSYLLLFYFIFINETKGYFIIQEEGCGQQKIAEQGRWPAVEGSEPLSLNVTTLPTGPPPARQYHGSCQHCPHPSLMRYRILFSMNCVKMFFDAMRSDYGCQSKWKIVRKVLLRPNTKKKTSRSPSPHSWRTSLFCTRSAPFLSSFSYCVKNIRKSPRTCQTANRPGISSIFLFLLFNGQACIGPYSRQVWSCSSKTDPIPEEKLWIHQLTDSP